MVARKWCSGWPSWDLEAGAIELDFCGIFVWFSFSQFLLSPPCFARIIPFIKEDGRMGVSRKISGRLVLAGFKEPVGKGFGSDRGWFV